MSSFVKSKLKAARDALGKKQYEAAREAASQVLEYEPENYNANVFLALSHLELGQDDKSEQLYRKAIDLQPDQALAWQGISRLYERKKRWDDFAGSLEQLMRVFSASHDATKTAELLERLIDSRREHGSRQQLVTALFYYLPDSPFYELLSTLPPPDPTNPTSAATFVTQRAIHNSLPVIEEIVSLAERDEEAFLKTEFDKRRTRLGAPPQHQLRKEIGLETWKASKLPLLYQEILNHLNTSDDLRRLTEAKLIRHKQQYFYALPSSDPTKTVIGAELDELVNGVVVIEIPDELAWSIFLNGMDRNTNGYGLDHLKKYIQLLPDTHMAQLLKGYFMYTGTPITDGGEDEEEESPRLVGADCEPFNMIMDAFTSLQHSLLATRIAAEVYLEEMDYSSVINVAENGLQLVKQHEQNTGRKLREVRKAFNVALATALVHLYPPKHHRRALPILDDVLKQDSGSVDALIARGYVLQHAEKWKDAEVVFAKAAELIPTATRKEVRVREERAWCLGRIRTAEGVEALKGVLRDLEDEDSKLDRARCLWRIGKGCWDMGDAFREEAYTLYIQSLKCDKEYAPSYTSLGVYYSEFASPPDPTRASKCFQKAFELDPREVEAARRLAEGFADEREWDLVEVVARRTIEGEGGLDAGIQGSGVVAGKYLPTNAWAWKALGVVELTRRNYPQSIEAFQVALRANQEDQLAWLRLGEAYSKAGRHAAALKALARAHELDPDHWVCTYFIGEVQRQTGKLVEALDSFESVLEQRPGETGVLVSLAQTQLDLARQEWLGGFFARAEQTLASVIATGLAAVRASSGCGSVAWKVIADALLGLSKASTFVDAGVIRDVLAQTTAVTKGLVRTRIAHVFSPRPIPSDALLTGSHALEAAVGAYDHCTTVGAIDDVAMGSALFDLGMALYLWSREQKATGREPASEVAASLVKEALCKEPGNPAYWTALAGMYFLDKPKASQHAYIRALELDSKNVAAWSQLGLLYLHHNDVELANEALLKAQILDPDYTLACVGQALVATANGHDEHARALLAHAVGLTADVPLADIEFAARVFRSLSNTPRRQSPAQEELLPAFAVLNRFAQRSPTDPCALHLLGLVYERLGQLEQAAERISRAIALLEAAYEETEDPALERQFTIAHTNLARVKVGLGDYTGALESFETALGLLPEGGGGDDRADGEVAILRVQALFGSGLAHFKRGDLQNAMTTFQAALDATGENNVLRGHVAVLLAQSMWAIGTDEFRESAKALLLDSITTDPENLIAINTLAGMGILTADDSLVDAALSEIQSLPIERRQELDPHKEVTYLLIQHHLAQGDAERAVRVAQKALYIEPLSLSLRRDLAALMLQQGSTRSTRAILETASASCDAGVEEARETLALAAIAAGQGSDALRCAQKAVVLHPGDMKNWKALAYVRARDDGSL